MTTIKSTLNLIKTELDEIKSAKQRIGDYLEELNTFNPFEVGTELVGNDWSHTDKIFVCDITFVSDVSKSALKSSRLARMPRFFIAEGFVKLKDGRLGKNRTTRSIKIRDVLGEDYDEFNR